MLRRICVLLTLALLSSSAAAVPATYEFSAGTLTSVRLDATTGEATNCPIQGATSCLTNGTIELTGSIVYDDETGLISNLEFSLVDTAVLDVGMADIDQIILANFGYDSGGDPAFITAFGFQVLNGTFSTTLAVDDGTGNLTVVPDEEISAATLSLVQVDETTLEMDLSSAGIGTVCDPSDPNDCVVMEADFNFTAQVAALEVGFSTSDGSSTSLPSIVVTGTVNHGDAAVDVNGVAATVSGLGWSANVPLSVGSERVTATATRGSETAVADITVLRTASSAPPAPVPVPSPIDPAIVTNISEATSFIHAGQDAIQTGVTAGTIEALRGAVVRGRLLTNGGGPLPSVRITAEGHPELGETLSQSTGEFDFAVNGGGVVNLLFEREGYVSVRRRARPDWRDFDVLPDIVMVPRTATATAVNSSAGAAVALLDPVSDGLGTRQPLLFVPDQTTATAHLPGGGTTGLGTSWTVRTTELSAGPGAAERLPADVPPGVDPRWVFDFSLDEATNLSAETVTFSAPLALYFEDPSSAAVGDPIGFATYDPATLSWLPEAGGEIVQVTDTDSDGIAYTITGAGAGDGALVASNYAPGTKLRRYLVPHFSFGCGHAKPTFPTGAKEPTQKKAQPADGLDACDCDTGSSIVRVERQVWAEAIDIVGSPFDLHYESDRTPGYLAGNSLTIPLTGPSLPGPVEAVRLEVEVAGRRFTSSFPAFTDMSHTFVWDGLDAYGRALQGRQNAHVRIDYEYTGLSDGLPATLVKTQRYTSRIGPWDARGVGIGGWTISPHHTYDPDGKILFRGDGRRRSAEELPAVAKNWAGAIENGIGEPNGFSTGPANQYDLVQQAEPPAVAVDAAGAMYFPLNFPTNGFSIFKADHEGNIAFVNFVGPSHGEPNGKVSGLAVDTEGNVYVSDFLSHVVWKLAPNGSKSVFAGVLSSAGNGANGLPATSTQLSTPKGIAVGPDGSLYIADSGNHVVRRVRPDGITVVVAGDGTSGLAGVPGPATDATIGVPTSVAVGLEGELYVSFLGNRVFRVSVDGEIDFFAGNGQLGPNTGQELGDGGPALDAIIAAPSSLAVGPDGSVYVGTGSNGGASYLLWRIRPDGLAQIVAGKATPNFLANVTIESGRPAKDEEMDPSGVAVFPDGALAVADINSDTLRSYFWRIEPPMPGREVGDIYVVSQDGSELYRFDPNGRHLDTTDTLTGALLYTFDYTTGQLDKIEDGDGNVTEIVRTSGQVEIVPPLGSSTIVALDVEGFASSITNPAQEANLMASKANGLLDTFTKPGGAAFYISYDALGRLVRDDDPEGGFFAYERLQDAGGRTIVSSRPSGRGKSVSVDALPNGDVVETRVDFAGLATQRTMSANGENRTDLPDTIEIVRKGGPDPRFGWSASFDELLQINSGSVSFKLEQERETTVDASGALTLRTATVTINDRPTSRVVTYSDDGTTRTMVTDTEEGRQILNVLDSRGRVVETGVVGLEPLRVAYDALGRVDTFSQGAGSNERVVSFFYDANGNLEHVFDPLLRQVTFEYDNAGRVSRQIYPDTRFVDLGYDPRGNLSSATPPGQPAHILRYTGLDQEYEYEPPAVSSSDSRTFFTYDLDRNLDVVVRPDGSFIDAGYDSSGRLTSLEIPRGTIDLAYKSTTGQLDTVTAPGPGGGELIALAYDGGLLSGTTWSGTINGSVSHGFDDELRVGSQSVNGAFSESFVYDKDGLLTNAGVLAIARDPVHGLIRGTTLIGGSTITTTTNPNVFGEIDDESAAVDGNLLYFADYTRDALGRITQKVETIQGATTTYGYGYGVAGRLETVTVASGSTATTRVYGYDGNGNRVSLTENGTVQAIGAVDAQDRLLSYGSSTYTYDEAGDLLAKTDTSLPSGQQTTTYQYDALGNLTRVVLPDGTTTIDYVIDGKNRRIGKKINGTLVRGWLYQDQLSPVAELDGAGNVVARFVYGTRLNVPDYMIKGGTTYRILSDHLGSPRLVVNLSTGGIAQRLDYDEFGRTSVITGSADFQPLGFAGGLWDADVDFVRYGARDFDSTSGRFTTKDVLRLGSASTNLYEYAEGDPVNLIDRTGFQSESPGVVNTVTEFSRKITSRVGRFIADKLESFVFERYPQAEITKCEKEKEACYYDCPNPDTDQQKRNFRECDIQFAKCMTDAGVASEPQGPTDPGEPTDIIDAYNGRRSVDDVSHSRGPKVP